MPQTGYTPIQIYSSSTPTNAPSAGNLTNDTKGSELAINIADKNLFFKDSTNAVNTVPIRQSGAASDGWLSSTDWNTFNNKAPAGSYLTSVTADSPLSGAGTSASHLVIAQATTSTSGYLSSTDWNTFNNKQPAGSYLTAVTADAPLSGSGTSGSHLVIAQATTSTSGYLSSTDWNTFNNKQPAGTYVTSVSGTAPVVSSGGTTPAISMAAATGSVNGYLTSTDWTTFNGKQAALVSGTNIKTVSGTTLLGSGDLGTIGTGYGGTGLTSFTANGVLYASSTSALATGSAFTFSSSTVKLATTSANFYAEVPDGSGGGEALIKAGDASGRYFAMRGRSFDYNPGFFTNAASVVTINNKAAQAETMRWQSTGGVSIGTTTDPGASNLTVAGNIGVNVTSFSGVPTGSLSANGTVLAKGGLTGAQTDAAIINYSSNVASIRSYGATAGSGIVAIRCGGGGGSGDSEAMRAHASRGVSIGNTTDPGTGNLYVNGTGRFGTTVGVGAATPAASGAGITFPATQSASSDANTLDDYEEGTFTPTITSQTGSVTTYSTTGVYTKIGNNITIQVSVTLTNVGTAGGSLFVNGLPFTSKNVTGRSCIPLVREDNNTGVAYQGVVIGNNTYAQVSTLTNSAISWTNTNIYTFCATYQTA